MERKVCTIGEWLDVWYEVYAVPEYAPKTLEIYRDARKRLSRRSSPSGISGTTSPSSSCIGWARGS